MQVIQSLNVSVILVTLLTLFQSTDEVWTAAMEGRLRHSLQQVMLKEHRWMLACCRGGYGVGVSCGCVVGGCRGVVCGVEVWCRVDVGMG